MIIAPIPENEQERLEELKKLEILDSPSEQDYEDVVKLASAICQTPISLVSLIDAQRQWFKARVGLDAQQTSRDVSFCAHAIQDDDLMVVPDAVEDQRFFDNPLVTGNPNIRFYAGMPLITRTGFKIGTLCIIDSIPRHLTDEQKFALKTLGKQVVNMLELRLKNNKLSQLNSLQNKFLAIISHDVRNPLVAVNSLIKLMDEAQLTADDFKDLSGQLDAQVTQTIELLNNLIDWGISQTRGDKLDLQRVHIQALVQDEFTRIAGAARAKKLQLLNNIAPDETIIGDVNMLKFITRNLITNAIKFTAEGSVAVSLENNKHGWEIKVEDTGVGIPAEKQKKLFNWENRVTTQGTNNEGGSGLGLLMCKEFAEKHLGTITVKSEPGKGTTISATINTRFLDVDGLQPS